MSEDSIVFLPGMMLDGRLYAHQVEHLGQRYEPIVADLTRSSSVGGLAEDVLREAPRKFALVGLSLGGIVALEMWRRAPARVTHLALLGTTCHGDQRRELRLEQIARVERGELSEVTRSMKPLYLALSNRANQRMLDLIHDMGLGLGSEVFIRQSHALRDRRDNADALATITCPTLVLCGREDKLCALDIHLEMARSIAHADLSVLSDCGHLSALERPEAVTTALDMLLRRAA